MDYREQVVALVPSEAELEAEEVTWTCPKCGELNVDYPYFTAFPICGDCNHESSWEEIERLLESAYEAKIAREEQESLSNPNGPGSWDRDDYLASLGE